MTRFDGPLVLFGVLSALLFLAAAAWEAGGYAKPSLIALACGGGFFTLACGCLAMRPRNGSEDQP